MAATAKPQLLLRHAPNPPALPKTRPAKIALGIFLCFAVSSVALYFVSSNIPYHTSFPLTLPHLTNSSHTTPRLELDHQLKRGTLESSHLPVSPRPHPRHPGIYTWTTGPHRSQPPLDHLADAIRAADDLRMNRSGRFADDAMRAHYNSRPWIVNLNFWEKLAAGRVAFAKYTEFAREVFPEFAVVEPCFQTTTVLLGKRPGDPTDTVIPAGHFYDFSSFHTDLGITLVPLHWAAQDVNSRVSTIIIYIDYRSTVKQPPDNFTIPCNPGRAQYSIRAYAQWLRDSNDNRVVCLAHQIFVSPNANQIFRDLAAGYSRVLFENLDNRAKISSGKSVLPHLRWRSEWHNTMAVTQRHLFGQEPYVAINFRTGKFLHHKKAHRIASCAEHVFETAAEEASSRNIRYAFAALDVLGQGEGQHYTRLILSALGRTVATLMPVFVSRSPRKLSGNQTTLLTDTVPGKALLDLLFISNAHLFVGSGAETGFARLAMQASNITKNSHIQVFCMKDEHWKAHALSDSAT